MDDITDEGTVDAAEERLRHLRETIAAKDKEIIQRRTSGSVDGIAAMETELRDLREEMREVEVALYELKEAAFDLAQAEEEYRRKVRNVCDKKEILRQKQQTTRRIAGFQD